MLWLQNLDINVFRFINQQMVNPVFDVLMPLLSGGGPAKTLLIVFGVLAGLVLIWKERVRSRAVLFLFMLVLVIAVGDGFICNTLKHAVGRDRPFLSLPDVRCLVGKSGSGSMPSSHAANWFSATMVALLYYRRSLWFMLPAALLISFSRIYNGVHYPSDVLAGAILGAGYAAAIVWSLNALWMWAGQKWFPLWWAKLPSLVTPPARAAGEEELEEELVALPKVRGQAPAGFRAPHVTLDDHWLRLGYVVIGVLLLVRWAYLASGVIQLAEDEAYQWVWSKHLALSYYSKPPLIAYTQFLGTSLWGDTAFGVRFFSPLIGALLGVVTLRFFAREVNARAGFFLLLMVSATPLLAVGSILMTVDPLNVLFWTAAMFAGWRAIQDKSTTKDWLWVGVWMGLGLMSKYTELLQWVSWVVLFILYPPARKQLRRPGPYLALVVNALFSLPMVIWNCQHDWATAGHLADNAALKSEWHPTLRYLGDFLGAELGLLNPVFFIATVWAGIAFWRRGRQNPRLVFFFSMGAPLFLIYLFYSFHSRILPNWIAPSVLPLFCMMVIYWDTRWRMGAQRLKPWLITGLVLGAILVVFGHNTDLVGKITKTPLPVHLDILHRVRQWDETARTVNQVREELLAEGKPVFIIADHYGMTGQISFYLPEARAAMKETPLVYCRKTEFPQNQFYFWPSYDQRKGENAIFVIELNRDNPERQGIPADLQQQFESVTDLGVRNVMYHDRYVLRPLQFFACRNLR